jgi:hypothetical protein
VVPPEKPSEVGTGNPERVDEPLQPDVEAPSPHTPERPQIPSVPEPGPEVPPQEDDEPDQLELEYDPILD